MSLVSLLVTLVLVGILLWAVNAFIPMDGKIRAILNALVIIIVILWLFQSFGVLGSVGSVRVR